MSNYINEPFVNSPIEQLDFSTNTVSKSESMKDKLPASNSPLFFYNGRYYIRRTTNDFPHFKEPQENKCSDYTLKIISTLGTAFIATLPKLISTIYDISSNKKE